MHYNLGWEWDILHSLNLEVLEIKSRTAVVHFNLRAGSTFPVPVCTVSPGLWVNKADTQYGLAGANKFDLDAVKLYASYRLNLLLPKGQRCVVFIIINSAPYGYEF